MTTTTTTPGVPRAAARTKVLQRQGAAVALVLMVAVSWLVFPRFGSLDNLRDLALQGSFLVVIAIGMTFVIITGGIDLSVGSLYALGGVLAAWGSQYGFLVALALPLVVCGLIGLINGLLIARTNMAPFIVTLASLLFARGLLLAITDEGANTYQIPGDSAFVELGRGTVFGFGYPIFIAAVLAVLGGMVLHRTSFGQNVFATGGAEQSAVLLGVPVAKTKVLVYTMSGTLAGLAGALTAAYLQSGVTVIGVGLELDAIAVVVIGGTLLTGGMGTVLGTVIGVGLIKVIQNVINQIGTLDSNYQSVVSGVFLLIVVVLQRILRR